MNKRELGNEIVYLREDLKRIDANLYGNFDQKVNKAYFIENDKGAAGGVVEDRRRRSIPRGSWLLDVGRRFQAHHPHLHATARNGDSRRWQCRSQCALLLARGPSRVRDLRNLLEPVLGRSPKWLVHSVELAQHCAEELR